MSGCPNESHAWVRYPKDFHVCSDCGLNRVAPNLTEYTEADVNARYAMARLIERLVAEDYVRDDRSKELLNRAHNLELGRGFLTNQELKTKQSEEDFLS